ncbi:hypothetical protein ACX80O_02325 [Arthrobacter sp. Hz1]
MKDVGTTILDLLGVALIVAGFVLIYVPAAFLVAGVGCLAVSWRVANRARLTEAIDR